MVADCFEDDGGEPPIVTSVLLTRDQYDNLQEFVGW